jgi:hypothetical protein
MRYLKKFLESYTQEELNELKGFCDEHLSYLIDDDYKVIVEDFETNAGSVFQVVVRPPKVTKKTGWIEKFKTHLAEVEVGTPFSHFKDRLIPFVYMLLKDYRLLTNEELDRMRLGDNESSMGFAKPNPSNMMSNTEMIRVGSLDHLEQVEDNEMVSAFYIRIKKKD